MAWIEAPTQSRKRSVNRYSPSLWHRAGARPKFPVPARASTFPGSREEGRGYLGQYIVVVPSRRLVIVRLGVSHLRRSDLEGTGRLVGEVTEALAD
jgi:hypothetical protein